MKTYKRAWNTLLAGLIGAPFGGLVIVIIGSFFIKSGLILITAAVVVCFLIWFITIFGEAMRFTVSDDGEFCYYKRGKLKQQFDLKHCSIGYYRRSKGAADHYIQLKILPEGKTEAEMVVIDVSPLGQNRFERMFSQMETFSAGEPEILAAE